MEYSAPSLAINPIKCLWLEGPLSYSFRPHFRRCSEITSCTLYGSYSVRKYIKFFWLSRWAFCFGVFPNEFKILVINCMNEVELNLVISTFFSSSNLSKVIALVKTSREYQLACMQTLTSIGYELDNLRAWDAQGPDCLLQWKWESTSHKGSYDLNLKKQLWANSQEWSWSTSFSFHFFLD